MNYKKNFDNYYNYKFQTLISILDGCHGLSGNDPIFYYDRTLNEFLHIYYDGMFFNQNIEDYFCDDLRFLYNPKFKDKLIDELEKEILKKDFKKNLKNIYETKINGKNDKFEYFWKIFLKRYKTFKSKNERFVSFKNHKLSLNQKLSNINFFYPFIYSYSKKKKFYLCIKWPELDENIFIINEDKQILNKKNFNKCQKIKRDKVKKILNNNFQFYYPKEKIKINTSIIGNLNNENYIQ